MSPIDSPSALQPSMIQVGASGDNEAIEKVPDNEDAELASQAAKGAKQGELAPYQGRLIDIFA